MLPWARKKFKEYSTLTFFLILRAWRGLITGKAGTISNEYSSETTQDGNRHRAYWLKLILLSKDFLDVLRREEEEGQPLSFRLPHHVKKDFCATIMKIRLQGLNRLQQLQTGEKVGDFKGGGFRGIGTMGGVFADGRAELLAQGAGVGLGRIGGAHQVAPFLDGVGGFQHHDDAGAAAHEIGQFAEKRPGFVHVVEAFGFDPAQVQFFETDDLEAFGVNAGENFPGVAGGKGVRFDYGKGSFHD